MWDLEFQVIVEQELELCYCLAIAILSLMGNGEGRLLKKWAYQ